MNRGHVAALILACLTATATLPGAAAAQSYVAQPQLYLLTTDVFDGRALWVQPAALVKRREASISVLVTGARSDGVTILNQYGATIASSGFGLGWQHDQLGGGVKTNTWVVGYGFGGPRVSLGGDYRWHRGTNTSDRAFDIGGRYVPTGHLEMSIVWRDIGSPVILGDTIHSTVVPGAALQLFRAHLQLGVDWELVKRNWGTSSVRAGATLVLPARLALTLRSEFDGSFNVRTLSAALTWHTPTARVSGFGATSRTPDVDRFGLWGAAVTDPTRPRRRRFGG